MVNEIRTNINHVFPRFRGVQALFREEEIVHIRPKIAINNRKDLRLFLHIFGNGIYLHTNVLHPLPTTKMQTLIHFNLGNWKCGFAAACYETACYNNNLFCFSTKEPDWPHMAAWVTSSSSGQKCGDGAADKLPYLGKTLRVRLHASKNQSVTWNSPWNDSEKAAPLLFVGLAHKLSVKPVAEDKAADLHWVAAQSHRLATDWNSHLLHKRRSVYNQNHELQSAGEATTTECVLFFLHFPAPEGNLKDIWFCLFPLERQWRYPSSSFSHQKSLS